MFPLRDYINGNTAYTCTPFSSQANVEPPMQTSSPDHLQHEVVPFTLPPASTTLILEHPHQPLVVGHFNQDMSQLGGAIMTQHPPQQTSMFSSTGHFNQDMNHLSLVEAAIAQNGDEKEEDDDGLKENLACMQQNSEDKVS